MIDLRKPDDRKAAAFVVMFGGAVIMTAYAAAVLIMVRSNLLHTFWLGIAAHVQLFALLAGFIGFNIRRKISAGKDGIDYDDREAAGAEKVADAAKEKADEIKDGVA